MSPGLLAGRAWAVVVALGLVLLLLPEPQKTPLVGRNAWQVTEAFAQNVKPAPDEVSAQILKSNKSVFWRSWKPYTTPAGSAISGPFLAPPVVAVPLAGFPGKPGSELYLECIATAARRQIARGNPHENWVERTLWLGSWCPSEVRLVATSSSHDAYVAVGTPFSSSHLSYFKESVFVITLVHALGWILIVAPGLGVAFLLGVKDTRVALLSAVPITLALGYVAFFAVYLGGQAASRAVAVTTLAGVVVGAAQARRAWARFRSEPVVRAFALAFAISLSYVLAVYSADLGSGTWAAADRFAPAIWLSDAQLPQIVAEGIYGQRPILSMIGGGWHVSDRPPMLAGLLILGRSLWAPVLAIGDNQRLAYVFHQVTGAIACTLWVVPAWLLLGRVFSDRTSVTRVLALMATTGVILFNSVYVWPKMLAGTLGVAAHLALMHAAAADRPSLRTRSYIAAGLLAGMALMSHGGVAFGLAPVFAIPLLKPTRARLFGVALAGLAALIVVLPWAIWQRTVDPPGDALIKFALAGTWGWEDPAKGLWATIRDAHASMTITGWLRMRWDSVLTLFGGFRPPIIAWYWLQRSDFLGWRRAADFLFLFPALRAASLGFLAVVFLLGRRSPHQAAARIVCSWIALGLGGIAVATLVNFNVNIVHCQSYLSILLLLLGLYSALLYGPRWLLRAAVVLHVVYFAVVWVWSPLKEVELRPDVFVGWLMVTGALLYGLLRRHVAATSSPGSLPQG